MTVARLAISLDPALARQVRKAAGKTNLSAWAADALRRKLQADGLLAAVQEWEDEHGALTAAELHAAQRKQRRRR